MQKTHRNPASALAVAADGGAARRARPGRALPLCDTLGRGCAGRTGHPRAPQGSEAARRWGPSCLPGTKAHAGSAAFPTAAPVVRAIFNLVPNAATPLPPWLGAAAALRCVSTACGGPGPPGINARRARAGRGPSLPGVTPCPRASANAGCWAAESSDQHHAAAGLQPHPEGPLRLESPQPVCKPASAFQRQPLLT